MLGANEVVIELSEKNPVVLEKLWLTARMEGLNVISDYNPSLKNLQDLIEARIPLNESEKKDFYDMANHDIELVDELYRDVKEPPITNQLCLELNSHRYDKDFCVDKLIDAVKTVLHRDLCIESIQKTEKGFALDGEYCGRVYFIPGGLTPWNEDSVVIDNGRNLPSVIIPADALSGLNIEDGEIIESLKIKDGLVRSAKVEVTQTQGVKI